MPSVPARPGYPRRTRWMRVFCADCHVNYSRVVQEDAEIECVSCGSDNLRFINVKD